MKINFGTDGFRGVIGKDFTFKNALNAAGKALQYFKDKGAKSVAIGYDTRFLSPEIASDIAEYAKTCGFKVFLSRSFCPTPALSLFTKFYADFGIMVTASHNPPIYNGVKIKEKFGGSALPETIKEIINVCAIKPCKIKGSIENIDFFEFYYGFVTKMVDLKSINKYIKVVVDPMYGSAQNWFSNIMRDSVSKVVEINNYRNPLFNGINPEPMENNIDSLINTIKKEKFDIGFAFDGDGDRIACVDSFGNFYSSQKIIPIFLEYLVNKKKLTGLVVKTVSASSMIESIAYKNGLNFKEVPIGFKNIVPYILKNNVVIGGEESGGIYVNGYIPERDGIFCAMFMLYLLSIENKNLSEMWEHLERKYGRYVFERRDYHFKKEKRIRKKIENIDFDEVAGLRVVSKKFIDGKKFIFERGFLLLRLSGTEPVLRVYIETDSKEKLKALFNFIEKKLKRVGF